MISLSDKAEANRMSGMKMPKLKGHVKITLHNCRTGKNEVIEGDNIVTYAVRDIMANNYLGAVQYETLLPLADKWFGGILAFHDAFSVDGGGSPVQSDYFPPAPNTNALIAHAGDTAPASAAIVREDLMRGSPIDVIKTDHSVKRVWEWNTSQGNGVISSLALTHKDTGNVGLGNTSSAFKAFQPFEVISSLPNAQTDIKGKDSIFTQYDDNHGLYYAIGADGDYIPGHVKFSTNKVTVYLARLPYAKAGLHETQNADTSFVSKFTITSPNITFYANPCFWFDYTNKRLWLFTNVTSTSVDGSSGWDKSVINYIVIDCVNKTEYSHGTITSDAADLAPIGCGMDFTHNRGSKAIVYSIPKRENSFLFPMSSSVVMANGSTDYPELNITGYKMIRLDIQSDQHVITFNEAQKYYMPPISNGAMQIGSERVVYGTTGYTCAGNLQNPDFPTQVFNEPSSVSSYLVQCGRAVNISAPRMIVASKMILSTKFNLDNSVTKQGTQSMTIEYTLEET